MSNTLPDDFYGNALILAQDGRHLCTLNRKRIEWYLKRGLAEEITPPEGYPRAIKLNFKAKLDIRNPKSYELAIIKTECVLCGAPKGLTLHHVVPQCIRKHFPLHEKARSRQWCVLVCVPCHNKIEEVTQAVYQKDYPRGDIPIPERSAIVLRRLKAMGILHKMDVNKYHQFMANAGYMTNGDIPGPPTREDEKAIPSLVSKRHRALVSQWAQNFISQHGGIQGTKAYFRQLFLDFKPHYLPTGYLDLDPSNLTEP